LCYALDYGRYVEEVPLQWQNVSFWPPEWLQVILGWKDNETARKRHGTCTLWPKNQWKPHKMSSTRIWSKSERFRKNCPRCRKSGAIAHENGPKQTFSRSHKIWNRLARRPTMVVLCLRLWSVHGGGTVTMTKCVILASGMVASNSRLKRQWNGP
jgi:hypothetical protein